ncbi:MAG: TRAP transporter small permease [Hyphomonadaceae bacterium]|jgi:TRAP-type C4-dicarboxylate transport system permease small subunit|nr:TRAP transporter small permease [Hyphomonadaceae bacterium]
MTSGAPPASHGGLVADFRRGLDLLDWIIAKVVIVSMAIMVSVIIAQVFTRYALNLSLDWAEEISRLFFVASIFFAIPLGVKRGAHVGIALLTERLPPKLQDAFFRAMNGIAMLLMAVIAYEAAVLTRNQWDEPMSTLEFSVGWFMLPLAVGAAHAFLHLLNGLLSGQPQRQELATE